MRNLCVDSHPWLGLCLAGQVNVISGISDRNAAAIAKATVQISSVIIYTLYDSSWSQDFSSVGCIVVID